MIGQLTNFEVFHGSFTFASVIISTLLGIFICIKYFKLKNVELLLVGMTWILLASPYWSDTLQFLSTMILGVQIDPSLYYFLANAFIAPIHVIWLYAFTNFLYSKYQKIVVILFTLEAAAFEVIFIIVFFINPLLIGVQKSVFVVEWAIWIQIYLLISIILFLITGFLFARASIKAERKDLKLKGKFLLLAFITFAIGTIIDVIGASDPIEITIFLARTFVIISSVCFYIGFTLPKFIAALFIKETDNS